MEPDRGLLAELSRLDTLGALVRWTTHRVPRPDILEVVPLDEFTLDLILRIDGTLYAVFDTT